MLDSVDKCHCEKSFVFILDTPLILLLPSGQTSPLCKGIEENGQIFFVFFYIREREREREREFEFTQENGVYFLPNRASVGIVLKMTVLAVLSLMGE